MLQKTPATQVQDPTQRDRVEAPTPICVGIVPSHSLAAHYLVQLVKSNLNMAPVIFSDGVYSSKPFPPDAPVVILIDLWGLPLPTCEYLKAFSRAIPGSAFLAMDRSRKETDVAQLLRTGFSGFITHDEALYLLGPAIEAVAQRRIWTSPEVIRIYMNLTSRATLHDTGVEMLTVRENQILDLLRRRCSNKEMASLLGICESTVKFHVSNVLTKLNASNRRDLAETELFDSRLRLSKEGPRMGVVTSISREAALRTNPQPADGYGARKPDVLMRRAKTGC